MKKSSARTKTQRLGAGYRPTAGLFALSGLTRAIPGMLAAIVVSACSQGGSPPASPAASYPVFNPAAANALIASAEYLRIDLSTTEENTLRTILGLQPVCFGSANPNCASASTFKVQNVHQAHAATLANGQNVKGDGQLIAIVDEGFRKSHQDLSGKSIIEFTGGFTPQVASHGTAVAAVAAGLVNGSGILGVAPNANLHLSSWGNVPSTNILQFLAQATDHAAANGAVVQNNSWGWTNEKEAAQERTDFQASGQANYENFIVGRLGGSPTLWRNLFNSYDNFQRTGVVVYANSNDRSFGDASAWASLPLFVPELREAWIVVSNALLSVDSGTGAVIDADLISAPCGSAAAFCLTADGSVRAPSASSDTSYQIVSGTSFAAPQLAGHIALLAQAFPNLSPAEWTTRLLATAQNGWPDFTNSISGQVAFAPGVTRNHSSLFGLGIPNIQAALSPVGGLSISSGATVATASASSVESGLPAIAPVIGNSIANAIGDREIMLLDQLGTDFYRTGDEIGLTGSSTQWSGSGINTSRQIVGDIVSFAPGFAPQSLSGHAYDFADVLAPRLLFSQTQSGERMGNRFFGHYRLDADRSLQFSGEMTNFAGSPAASFTIARLKQSDGFATELSFSAGYRKDALFSSYSTGPLLSAAFTSDFSAGLTIGTPLALGWSLTGFAELGGGIVGQEAIALTRFGPIVHASAGLAATKRNIFVENDRFAIYTGMRSKAVSGTASIRLPVSRDQEGNIQYQNIEANVASSAIPFRAGIVYGANLPNDFGLMFNLNTDFDLPQTSWMATSLSLELRKRF